MDGKYIGVQYPISRYRHISCRLLMRQCCTMVCGIGVAACGDVRTQPLNSDGCVSDDAVQDGLGENSGVDAAPAPQLLSCVGLPMTCGALGNDSCCTSLEVPSGSYDRSFDLAGDANSGNTIYPATVSKFRIDKYEVTVGRFRAFPNAGMGTQSSPPMPNAGAHTGIAGSGWDAKWNTNLATNTATLVAAVNCSSYPTWTDTPAANEHRPMNCLTWYDAMAFCV